MKDCTTCKWDIVGLPLSPLYVGRRTICEQGHYRCGEGEGISIQNCHAWAEKEKCECVKKSEESFLPTTLFNMICKKCGKIYG